MYDTDDTATFFRVDQGSRGQNGEGGLKNPFFDIRGAFTEHCNSNIQRWGNEFKMSGANTWIDPNEVQNVM